MAILKDLVRLLLVSPRLLLDIILISIIVILTLLYNNYKSGMEYYSISNEMLSKNIKKMVKVNGNTVKIVFRDKDRIVEKIIYKPQEGSVSVSQPIDGSDIKIVVKNKGFTFRPGFGLLYDFNKLNPEIDSKLVFYSRYSSGIFLYRHGAGVFVSRHIDDLVPFKALNSELFLGYSLVGNNNKLNFGLRCNF